MKTLSRVAVVLSLFGLFASVNVPAATAAGSSYTSSKPKWNGAIVVRDPSGEVLEGAYVVGRNVPLGQNALGLSLLNRNDGRTYDRTDANGRAIARIRPFGSIVAWKPGFAPVRYEWNLGYDTSLPVPSAEGILTIVLKPVATADRKASAQQAAKWLEHTKREAFIHFGGRAARSAELREEARAALIAEGVTE